MALAYLTYSRDHSLLELAAALAVGWSPVDDVGVDPSDLVRALGPELVPGAALPLAEVDLAQSLRRVQEHVALTERDRGGLPAALQVTRVGDADRLARQPFAEPLGLGAAEIGELDVRLALEPTFMVPGGLAVPDDQQPGHTAARRRR